MATLRELKGRIGSVKSSEKITGAMKMISSAKMHKAEGILRRLTPFRDCVQTIIGNLLTSDAAVSSPLATAHASTDRVALVVFGSDDGLCGGYNVNMFKYALERVEVVRESYGKQVKITVVPVGRKITRMMQAYSAKKGGIEVQTPEDVDSKTEGTKVKAFGQGFETDYLSGKLDRVELLFMRYYSAGRQRAVSEEYLPVSAETLQGDAKATGRPYLFEPDAMTVFATVIPMYLLSKMQEAFGHNRASEQAARVMAMQSANDNAQKLLEQLQLEYNKLRQQGITTELLDIVGGQARD
ncbi:MAG: ATP synthase F1 subunit gamma [Muribaculaceae bacterium]|nr:ATP synthase F1 subunit gamma [Muribaculaceae bacterium]